MTDQLVMQVPVMLQFLSLITRISFKKKKAGDDLELPVLKIRKLEPFLVFSSGGKAWCKEALIW